MDGNYIMENSLFWIRFDYKFQYQIKMKKARADKCQPQSITLSSKRGSLNQEQLFVPYKIDWKNSPLQNVETNTSKAFFQNMKAELSNIKTDFQKLIKKEGSVNNQDYKSASKPKCQSAYKKDAKKILFDRYPENERLEIVKNNNREDNDNFFKILNLEKNLPCSSGADYKSISSKAVTLKDNFIKESKGTHPPSETIDLHSNHNTRVQSSRGQKLTSEIKYQEKEKEITYLKETICSLQAEVKDARDERDFTKSQAQRLFAQKNVLMGKLNELSNELGHKIDLAVQQEGKIKQLMDQLSRHQQQNLQQGCLEQQFSNERNFYTERINQLIFHNQNLGNINMELGGENQTLKENIAGFERLVDDLRRQGANTEGDFKRKMEYMQRQMQEYQKREDMFSKQIEKLSGDLRHALSNSVAPAIQGSNREEVLELKDQIHHLIKQVNIQKEIHEALSKRYEEQIASLKIEEISREFEEKTNRLIDENCKLKTKINHCESSLESTSEQNRSFIAQIALYEQRERKLSTNKQLSCNEWEQLTQRIEHLQEENKKLQEDLDFRSLKAETEQGQDVVLPTANYDHLVRMANLQLFENEKLKETIKELSSALKAAEQKVESLKVMQAKLSEAVAFNQGSMDASKLTRRHEEIYNQLQNKNRQIQCIKQLVFKVLIEKSNKLEDEEELEYYLRQIESKKSLFQI